MVYFGRGFVFIFVISEYEYILFLSMRRQFTFARVFSATVLIFANVSCGASRRGYPPCDPFWLAFWAQRSQQKWAKSRSLVTTTDGFLSWILFFVWQARLVVSSSLHGLWLRREATLLAVFMTLSFYAGGRVSTVTVLSLPAVVEVTVTGSNRSAKSIDLSALLPAAILIHARSAIWREDHSRSIVDIELFWLIDSDRITAAHQSPL